MENKKNNGKKITIFALILSVISVGILVFGFSLISSDKVVVLQSISNLYNKVSKIPDTEKEMLNKIASSKSVGIKASVSGSFQDETIGVDFDLLENKESKKSKIDFDLKYNEEELIGAIFALTEDKMHAFVKDVTPTFYNTEYNYQNLIMTLSGDDYDKISSFIKDAVKESVEKEDITKEKATISYNGKDKKINKLTYKVTVKEVKEILDNFIKSLKSDKKLVSNIANLIGITQDELTKSLDDALNEKLEDEVMDNVLFDYHVYYYGFNKIVQYEIYEPESKTLLQYKVQNQSTISFEQDGVKLFGLDYKKEKNEYTYTLKLLVPESEQYLEITGTYKDKTLTASFMQDGMTMTLTITSDLKKNDNNYVSNISVKLSASALGISTDLGQLKANSEVYFNKDIDIDLSNSKSVDEITEEESNQMMLNLQNNKFYQMVMEVINMYKPLIESMIQEQMPEYLNINEPWNDFSMNEEEF